MTTTTEDAINSLRNLTKCTCHEAYSGRGMEDPNCLHHEYADYVEALAARVVALEEAVDKAIAFIAQAIEQGDVVTIALDDFDKMAAYLARAKLEERG